MSRRRALVLLLWLCACAAPVAREGRRVPRGWTLDSSKQDIAAVNVREQKAFGEGKTIKVDNYSSESLTTAATLSPNDGKEQLRALVAAYNKLKCKDTALEAALNEYQDWHCLATRRIVEKLEVHVSTSIGAMRAAEHWPLFRVKLGTSGQNDFGKVPAVDGGTIVFRTTFALDEAEPTHGYNMQEVVKQITFELTNAAAFTALKERFGREFCADGSWFSGCGAGQSKTQQRSYYIATNTVIIDRVEVYLYFVDDERPYKVFASDTSSAKPLARLDQINQHYSIANFKNNPHWLLHYHSRRCKSWGDKNHDGSDFGKYVWDNYIAKENPNTIDVYTQLTCAGTSHMPVYVDPEIPAIDNISKDDAVAAWVEENASSFKPSANRREPECQIRTAKVIVQEAEDQNKCGVTEEQELQVPSDLDSWTAERLKSKAVDMQKANNELEISAEGKITDLNAITGNGCFYEQPLLAGIQVEITGQRLVNVGGRLMTRKRAEECIFKRGSQLGEPRDNPLYINLGLHELSYPIIIADSGEVENGKFSYTGEGKLHIGEGYTEKFALRDVLFLHLARQQNSSVFVKERVIETTDRDGFLSNTSGVDLLSTSVEYGVVAVHSIELIFNGSTIYKVGSPYTDSQWAGLNDDRGRCDFSTSDVLESLFILTDSNSAWSDYGLRSNAAWVKWRDEVDHCAVKETE